MIDDCEICNTLGTPVMLAGGPVVRLCIAHRREWNKVTLAFEGYQRLCVAEAELAHAVQVCEKEVYLAQLVAAMISAKRDMVAFAEKWLADARQYHEIDQDVLCRDERTVKGEHD